MQFLLVAYDATDSEALNRRLQVREEHFKRIGNLKKAGEFLAGGAILSDEGKMIGSMIIYEYPEIKGLHEQLKEEPYLTAGVWEKIEIRPFRLANIE